MNQKCDKCGSTETEGHEIAHLVPDGGRVKYLGETELSWFECKDCKWTWKAQENN